MSVCSILTLRSLEKGGKHTIRVVKNKISPSPLTTKHIFQMTPWNKNVTNLFKQLNWNMTNRRGRRKYVRLSWIHLHNIQYQIDKIVCSITPMSLTQTYKNKTITDLEIFQNKLQRLPYLHNLFYTMTSCIFLCLMCIFSFFFIALLLLRTKLWYYISYELAWH